MSYILQLFTILFYTIFFFLGLSEKLPPTPHNSPLKLVLTNDLVYRQDSCSEEGARGCIQQSKCLDINSHISSDNGCDNMQHYANFDFTLPTIINENSEQAGHKQIDAGSITSAQIILPENNCSKFDDTAIDTCQHSIEKCDNGDTQLKMNIHRHTVNDERYDESSDDSFNDFEQAIELKKEKFSDKSRDVWPTKTAGDFNDFAVSDLVSDSNIHNSLPDNDSTGNFPVLQLPIETDTAILVRSTTDEIKTLVTDFDVEEEISDSTEQKFEAFANFEITEISSSDKIIFKTDFRSGSEVRNLSCDIIAEDVVMSCSLPTIEGTSENSPDDEFGYRDIDIETDSISGSPLPMVEARNEMVTQSSEAQEQDSVDDDFDDFVTSTSYVDSVAVAAPVEEFDDFAAAKIDDAFDKFSIGLSDKKSPDDDEDFGEWSGAADDGRKCSLTGGLIRLSSSEVGPGITSPVDPLLLKVKENTKFILVCGQQINNCTCYYLLA